MSGPGLYIHVPFCKSKCPYCAFYSIVSTSLKDRWVDALRREVASYRGGFQPFDTLYIGGGTPSTLSLEDLGTILGAVRSCLDSAPFTEMTIEVNPGDLTAEKAEGYQALGIDRINLGVQSFDDKTLSILGRRHRAAESISALKTLRSCGFTNVGLDLIYGTGAQGIEEWTETLRRAVEFSPEHISCYQLTYEEGTPLKEKRERGEIGAVSEEEEVRFFLTTSEILRGNGYDHYEVSNFSKGRQYRSRHNSKYWDHTPYLGLGPSAHSFDGSERWWNHRSVEVYCDRLERGTAPVEGRERLTCGQLELESLLLGLRTSSGVRIDSVQEEEMRGAIEGLVSSGHLIMEQGVLRPTLKGLLIADKLPLLLAP